MGELQGRRHFIAEGEGRVIDCLVVGIGGFLGALLRHLVGMFAMSPENGFPVHTLSINILGSFAIGVIAAAALRTGSHPGERWILFLKVGLCGGFTTFSSFSLESVELLRSGGTWLGVLYMVMSVFGCLGAVLAGQWLVSR